MKPNAIINSLLRGKLPERMGKYEFYWSDTLKKWAAEEGYPTDEKGKPVDPYLYFDMDMNNAGAWYDMMPNRGYKKIMDESDEWVVTENGAGASLKYWKEKNGTPEHIAFKMANRQIWENDYRHHLVDVDRERLQIELWRDNLSEIRQRDKFAFFGNVFVWETMRASLGDENMLMSLILDPEWIMDFNRIYTDHQKAHYKIVFDECGIPDAFFYFEDLGYRNGLFCSPAVLDSLIIPYYTEMVDFFHSYDLPVILHTCGGITEGLPYICKAGFDGLHAMEVKAGCDLLSIAKDYGDQLTLIGGIDVRILESGSRNAIKNEVIRVTSGIRDMGARYLFGTDHSISPNVKLEDYKYFLDIFAENSHY